MKVSCSVITFWLFSLVVVGQTKHQFATDAKVLLKGQTLFQEQCSACHSFLQKGIGPSLERATTELDVDYLRKMIRNAGEKINSGDARAVQLLGEYKQIMPSFEQLSDDEVEALLGYIHLNQRFVADRKATALGTPILDPIPAKIKASGKTLQLKHITTAPPTATKAPMARINKVEVLKGAQPRFFGVELRGKLYEIVDNEWRTVLDMTQLRPNFIPSPGLATGFGSFAFHPEFYQNGLLYTTHTEKPNSAKADFSFADSIKVTLQWVITEWKITNPNNIPFEGTGRELFRINMESSIHGMQEITFNPLATKNSPDYGLLYVGIGDGGSSEHGFFQICNSLRTPWSSVLRIDPQGRNSANGKYGIPKINPFANDNNPQTLGEVYCRGFRNPNRIVWTPTGSMLITDIGHINIEEVNIGVAGADYGWPEREGTFVINHFGKMNVVYALPIKEPKKYTYPVIQYDHDEGNAVSGGVVYEGKALPALRGKYLFTDIKMGRIFWADGRQLKQGQRADIQELNLEIDGVMTTLQALNPKDKPDVRMGAGINGELFVITKADGKMYQVVGLK